MRRDEVRGEDDLDARLRRAARATDAIAPTAGLVDAVMTERIATARRAPRREDVVEGVARSGPWAVVLAGVAAAAVALLSVQAEQQVAGELVATIDAAEVSP